MASAAAVRPRRAPDIIVETAAGLPAAGAFLIILAAVLLFFILPLLLFVVEVVVALAAVLFLRGTWIIEAETAGPPPEKKTLKVRGWSRSKRAVQEVASELRAGVEAAPAEAEPA